jgi:hypothetical protein
MAGHRRAEAVAESFRPGACNSNAYWPAPYAVPDWSRYQNGAESAPAGH